VKVAVIGLGASGTAAARLALKEKGEVYVSDLDTDAQAAARGAQLRELGADVQLGGHDLERMAGADLVVASPGIPPDAPVLRGLAERGIRWISEPELAVRFFRGSLIAVTGTNGKTTTSMLTAHLLESAGHRVALGGNVGGGLAPAASELALLESAPEWYVLELSSFQLAGIETMRPDIGVLTNLSPDHLDRYESLDAYYADKARLFDNADDASRWVLPAGDAAVGELAGDAPGERFHFGGDAEARSDAFLDGDVLTLRVADEPRPLMSGTELPLLGRHNRVNALAAALTAHLAGASVRGITDGLRSARPLSHRLEPVVERDGVLWVNDSKATNVAATQSALASLERPVVLLLGGKDKGEPLAGLRDSLAGVRSVVVFGAAADRMIEELHGAALLVRAGGDFSSVLGVAKDLALPGDIVLLSPACSSFDMFDSYEHRGRRFAELAREIA
jgi:UDP-N-acetylmuramoylalanine--D-glutamate ligase